MSAPEPNAPTSNPPHGKVRIAAECALVFAIAIVTFWKALPTHFLTSDYDWLAVAKYGDGELEFLKKTLTAYRWFAGELFRAAYSIFGDESAWPYRATLLLIHVMNAILCGRLAARILQRPRAAWIASVIFVVAPASAEAVHSISAFVYPCVTFLLLSGLLLYDRAIERGSPVQWAAAFVCIGGAAALREHWVVAFPLMLLLEISRSGGPGVFKTRGPWMRLGPVIVAGAAFMIFRHVVNNNPLVPSMPEYQFNISMVSRLVVTLEQLVLPPLPLEFAAHATLHECVGIFLILVTLVAVYFGRREDRWRAGSLLFALFLALAPFLPVAGDHIRQRFAYFGTAFAAALAAYVICILAERMSPRVVLPAVAAMLVGLLLEQQAEFERDYTRAAHETRIRIPTYRIASRWVRENDDIAFFVGDLQPNFVGISSMLRVTNDVSRRQVMQIKVTNFDQFYKKFTELRGLTNAKGNPRVFLRGPESYEYIRVTSFEEAIRHIFETGLDTPKELTIFTLLPRPLDTTVPSSAESTPRK